MEANPASCAAYGKGGEGRQQSRDAFVELGKERDDHLGYALAGRRCDGLSFRPCPTTGWIAGLRGRLPATGSSPRLKLQL